MVYTPSMTVEDLLPYIDEEIEYPDTLETDPEVKVQRFFLNINRTSEGRWACGYVHYAGEDDTEMAIPRLFINDAETLDEVATRMAAKYERWKVIRKNG